jgi:hypothetical protein
VASDRDKALQALNIAANGMNADYVSFAFEGWRAFQETNPDTGESWGPGEMQAYVEKHGAGDVIGECINTFVADRRGNVAFSTMSFAQKGSSVEWIDEDLREADGSAMGYIPSSIEQIMKQQKMSERVPQVLQRMGEELGEERAMFHQDMAILNVIGEQEPKLLLGAVLQAEKGTLRQELIHERFGEAGTRLN